MGITEAHAALRHFKPERLKDWDTRAFFAMHDLPSGDRMALAMLLIAAMGTKAGRGLRVPRFGDNGIITKERKIRTRYIDRRNVDCGERDVMTVDQCNHLLSWLMDAIQATDDDYKAIVNTVNAWISRDETQVGLHVERQRASIEENPPDLSGLEDDIAASEAKKAERDAKAKETK